MIWGGWGEVCTEVPECDGLLSGSNDVRSEHDRGAESEPSAAIITWKPWKIWDRLERGEAGCAGLSTIGSSSPVEVAVERGVCLPVGEGTRNGPECRVLDSKLRLGAGCYKLREKSNESPGDDIKMFEYHPSGWDTRMRNEYET